MDPTMASSSKGRLIHLRTKAEIEAKFETTEVYITQVKPRLANPSIVYVVGGACMIVQLTIAEPLMPW